MTTNRCWLVNGDPRGRALSLSDWVVDESDLKSLSQGEVRVRTEVLAFQPAQKGQMEVIPGYSGGNLIGKVMGAEGIGEVVESNAGEIAIGTKVIGPLGWQEFADLKPHQVRVLPDDGLLTAHLGPLGSSGLTAYFGLLRIGEPEAGDTVVISGAAGAVGSTAGQIAKLSGCHVIGTAGGRQKCDWLVNEVGYDAAIDYKNDHVKTRLKEFASNGVNVFFDNVGGPVLNDVLSRIAPRARVVICGGISRYEQETLPAGPANYFNIVFRQARIEGFLLSGYEKEYPQAVERITQWIKDGRLVYREDIQEGFENIPATLMRLFTGQNFGKQLLRL